MALLILDVDGCLSKNKTYTGKMTVCKAFNDHDWTAMKLFKVKGWDVCVISGDEWNRSLFEGRKIDFYSSVQEDGTLRKEKLLPMLKEKYNPTGDCVVFVGDDIFDLAIMRETISYCPKDASKLLIRMMGFDNHPEFILGESGSGIVEDLFIKIFGKITEEDLENLIKLDAKERNT